MSTSRQTQAVLAAAKAKAAKQRICDIWSACLAVKHKEVKKTSPAEVAVVLDGLDWEPKYPIARKNTHVCWMNMFHFQIYYNTTILNLFIKFY